MPDPKLIRRWQQREGLVLPDELLPQLPSLPRNHPKRSYWELQGYALERLAARTRLLPYRLSVLVVGCGNGWSAKYLSRLEKTTVLGIDFVQANIDQARWAFKEDLNPDFQLADIFEDAIDPSAFDMVVFNGIAEVYPDVGLLLGQALEFLNPKGEVHLIGTPFWELSRIPSARKKQMAHFEKIGVPEMKDHYYFHSVEEMTALGCHLLYSPYVRNGSLKSRVHRGKDSPYPWWMLPGR